ncbi:unnamed protein product [Didymodactylos carnosus]|uniref:Superoxide dismutase copper/zinc binding domain-containing protein n=1 Tax=Didymodactylos carnosus TaxID=1234261 RepID=A0A814KJT3_9BILA|nr:unnamed protein product [Didymodactylos carnosus]CAF1050501.1 unnamed protein product [Didymodactylos carnosus]CAF3550613.1 unnamed protein product [Didymodactylos carnosus]CAF3820216.1 unnamed protein product [Didymodactylos carnosus]
MPQSNSASLVSKLQTPLISSSKSIVNVQAVCTLYGDGVTGCIRFSQPIGSIHVKIQGEIQNLPPNTKHGMHIHTFGDLSDAGPHYNPENKGHGAPFDLEHRHMGDLGNIESNQDGIAKFEIMDQKITLFGPYTIIGRSCIISEKEDDYARGETEDSKLNGSTGAKLASGIIGIANNVA